jgi:hypothetical protein
MDTIRLAVAVTILATGLIGCATSTPPDLTTFTDAELYAARQRAMEDLERERLRDLPPEHPTLSRVDADTAEREHGQSQQCVDYLVQTLDSIDAELSTRVVRLAETYE